MELLELFAFNPSTFAGLLPFAVYFIAAIILFSLFKVVYTKITPYNEIELIKQGNTAAGVSFGGASIGFAIVLAEAISSSSSVVDFVIWGIVALLVQILVFFLLQRPFPKLVERIERGEVAMGSYLACTSIAAGLLNAACMAA